MTGSTTVTLINQATAQLSTTFTTLLPILIAVAVPLAVGYGIYHWLLGAARMR